MVISALIEALQKELHVHGDVEVFATCPPCSCHDYEGAACTSGFAIEQVAIDPYDDTLVSLSCNTEG